MDKLNGHTTNHPISLPFKEMNIRSLLLVGTILGAGFTTSAVQAQVPDAEPDRVEQTRNASEDETRSDDEDREAGPETIVVLGSRLRNPVFASEQPVAIISREIAEARGEGTLEEFVRQSPLVTGSQQSDAQQAAVFIGGRSVNGGNGINTISLRGLGQERTLVLLDGRRLTPSGTGGGVSVPDLAIIPSTMISQVQILKDGASSVYGSDAIAGIVDNRLMGPTSESMISSLVNLTEDTGGEYYQVAGRFSREFDGAHFNIGVQYDRRERQRVRDRDYTDCRDMRLFDPDTNERVDVRDANGDIVCVANEFSSNNRFFLFRGGSGNYFDPDSINARFSGLYVPDPNGTIVGPGQDEMRGILPGFARVGVENLGRTSFNQPTFGPDGGDAAQVAQSNALMPQTSEHALNSNALNPFERYSLLASGAKNIGDNAELYIRALYAHSEFEVNSYRYLFQNLGPEHPSNIVADQVIAASNGVLFGDLGFNMHLPYYSNTETDYVWLSGGVRGSFNANWPLIAGWDYDFYASYGRSDASYTQNFTREDRLRATTGYTNTGCNPTLINPDFVDAGQTAQGLCDSIGGAIPWLSARILRDGQFTPEEEAFLNGEETGTTVYDQVVVEGFMSGEVGVPVMPNELSVALGFHVRKDSIDDQPGPNSVAGNNHNFSTAVPTKGDYTIQEVFGEIGLPIAENLPGLELLHVSLSGRYTDNNRINDGGASTYRLSGSYKPVEAIMFRANYGTSYRAPALYELFQGQSVSFGAGDPCANLQNSQRPQNEVDNLIQNCSLFGIGTDFQPTANVRTLNQGNSTGTLKAETSDALNLGVVFTPDALDVSLAIDYYEIEVNDQIGRLGAQTIINRCLVNQSFASLDEFNNNQFCALLLPRDQDNNLTDVINGSINIAEQSSRGIDYSMRFSHDIGEFNIRFTGTITQVLEDFINLDKDFYDPFEDDIDRTLQALRPEWTGQFDLTVERGPLALFWSTSYIGESDQLNYELTDPNAFLDENGVGQFFGPYRFLDPVRTDTKVEQYWEHTASARYWFENLGLTVSGGVANVFNQEPPQVGNLVQRVGTSASGPYDFRGRRFFVRANKTF